MGVLMVATSMTLLLLRLWVNHDGGLPDGGVGQRYQSAHRLASQSRGASNGKLTDSDGAAAAAAAAEELEKVVVAQKKQ